MGKIWNGISGILELAWLDIIDTFKWMFSSVDEKSNGYFQKENNGSYEEWWGWNKEAKS